MHPYRTRFADLYDVFYADKAYDDEAAFVHRCLQQYGSGTARRILEMACGTGSHALALERLGYEVIATDGSDDMLAAARRKAAEVSSTVDFRCQDMRTLDVTERPFDAAVCLFDSIGYVATNEGLVQVLDGVFRHLRPGGLFVFEFWHAAAMLSRHEALRMRRWQVPEGEILRLSETTLDCARQLGCVTYNVYELRHDGTYAHCTETHVNRYFLVQEMAGWLMAARFVPLQWFAGFTPDERITDEVWHVVAVARRP